MPAPMIDSILESLRTEFATVVPLAVLFGVLAYLIKRDALIEDFRRARPEIVTNLMLLLLNAVVVVPLVAIPLVTGQSLCPRCCRSSRRSC